MDERGYPYYTDPDGSLYVFESLSLSKRIQKLVLITPTHYDQLFNVALLDLLDDGETSDEVESKNGDLIKVLATVFSIVQDFLDKNPDSTVGFRGSDARRQRLYRIVLNREFSNLSRFYNVFGGNPGNLQPFEANGDYLYYFIKNKGHEGNKDI